MVNLLCSGPGPHQPADGVLGQGDVAAPGLYCPASACQSAALAAAQPAITAAANRATMQQQAQTAITNNQTYLAIVSPTNAQVVAQVQALTQQNNKIIRLLLGKLDATN